MSYFDWNEKFETGIRDMDMQHRKLVQILNQYFDAMKSGQARDVLDVTLKELANYTKSHFASEEKLMEKFQYPQLEDHKKMHLALIKQVNEILSKLKEGKMINSVNLSSFLKDWLMNHILNSDKQYGQYINTRIAMAVNS